MRWRSCTAVAKQPYRRTLGPKDRIAEGRETAEFPKILPDFLTSGREAGAGEGSGEGLPPPYRLCGRRGVFVGTCSGEHDPTDTQPVRTGLNRPNRSESTEG